MRGSSRILLYGCRRIAQVAVPVIAIAAQDFEALPRRPPVSRAHRRELSNSEGRPRALGHCTSAHQLKRSLVFRLEFPQPGLDSREEMGIRTVRATQFGAFTRQTREAPCIHVEPRINQVAARGTYKLQHSHRYLTQSIAIKPLACSPKGVRGRFPVRRCLTTRRCGYLGPPSNSRCHSVTHAAIAASRDASTVGPRPTASWRSSKIFVSKARRQSRSLSRKVRRTRIV